MYKIYMKLSGFTSFRIWVKNRNSFLVTEIFKALMFDTSIQNNISHYVQGDQLNMAVFFEYLVKSHFL